MSHLGPTLTWPTWFRAGVIALGAVILCSCRAPIAQPPHAPLAARPTGNLTDAARQPLLATRHSQPMPAAPSMLPDRSGRRASDYQLVGYDAPLVGDNYGVGCGPNGSDCGTGCDTGCGPAGCVGMEGCPPGPWAPPGLPCPWPFDEYICDGGDRLPHVAVAHDWKVYGLDDEDTIIHYDQRDGSVDIEATNRVCIYAPRFASVRHVTPLSQAAATDIAGGVFSPTAVQREEEIQAPGRAVQRQPAMTDLATKPPTILRGVDVNAVTSRDLLAHDFTSGFMAHEDFLIIKSGVFEQSEKAMLAEHIDAAVAWTVDTGVQIVVEGHEALVFNGDKRAQATYTIDPNPPAKLRLVKVASVCDAKPGEIVEFTIRFDNVGASPMGNVTIVDNLTTRLELVEGSQQSSLKARFGTQRNEFGSLVLRWEILDPIEPGKGGIVRFKCKVR